MLRYVWVCLLVGCGWSERRFEVVGIDRLCEAAAGCAGSYDRAACVDLLRTTDRSKCNYDRHAGHDCMAQLDGAECVDESPFDVKQLAIPDPCYQAWDCDWLDLSAI